MSQEAPQTQLSDEAIASLRLSLVPNVGPQLHHRLMAYFGSANEVISAPPSALREVPSVGATLAGEIARAVDTINVQTELDRCREHQIQIIPFDDDSYPRNLREIPDPPPILYVQGDLREEDMLSIAIVGTRHATPYGKRQANRLASSLSRAGMTIISGLARGIDSEAHRGAIESDGRTLAVLPGGLTHVYPSENKELAFDISHQGALISESPSMTPISRGSFPRRNRIVTGMSLGVIVVEAGDRSGALLSARHAMEQDREVFAVPGPVDSRVSRGCHALLRDGARLVETADDVLDELGPLVESAARVTGETIHHPAELQLNEQEQQILQLVQTTSTNIDEVVRDSGLPVARVLATLSALEMRRLIRRVSGNTVIRA
jgi:DNA processing protein